MQRYDGIIFDLDGTLWDAVEAVVEIWNNALLSVGIEPKLNYDELSKCMGLLIEQIFDRVIPFATQEQRAAIKEKCTSTENYYLSEHGGILYDDVEETLDSLSKTHRLYIVSNCQEGYIQAFFNAHGLKKYFDDYECAGRTGKQKGDNISEIVRRNDLVRPVYVGDTVSDLEAATQANVPFIYAKYGFGDVEKYDACAEKFSDLKDLVF